MPGIIDRDIVNSGATVRALRSPKEHTCNGESRGKWEGSTFILDDEFIPSKSNPNKLTIAEIKKELQEKYNIEYTGIPFEGGVADFSSISLANISTKEIVLAAKNITSQKYDSMQPLKKVKTFKKVFKRSRSEKNFDIADMIAAKKQIDIKGLKHGYTAADLKAWRKQNHFSWDEQVKGGYNLVPAVIHLNTAHTGTVGSTKQSNKYLSRLEKHKKYYLKKLCVSENEAVISISELIKKNDIN